MARRGWARSIFLAALAGAGTAAAQLGLGYGLGIIAWVAPSGSDVGSSATGAWTAGLAWATWIAATSVVVGAIVGDRLGGNVESGPFVRTAWRLVMTMAATLGTTVVIPLVAVPASRAQIVDNYAPHLLAGIYAAIGVVVGLVVALIAQASRAVAANIFASGVWLWALAIIAVVDGVTAGRGLGYAQLAVWKFTDAGPMWRTFYLPGALLMLGTALLVGGLAAFPAAGRGDGRSGVAISGAMGPLLVGAAYVLAAPRTGEAPTEQVSAFHSAPFMVLAGFLGSLLVALVGSVSTRPRKPRVPTKATSLPAPGSTPSAVTATASVPTSSQAHLTDELPAGVPSPYPKRTS